MNGAPTFTFLWRVLLFLMLTPLSQQGFAQSKTAVEGSYKIMTKTSSRQISPKLKSELSQYDLFEISSFEIFNALKNKTDEQAINLYLGNRSWEMTLFPNKVVTEDFVSRVSARSGIHQLENIESFTYEGYVKDEQTTIRVTSTPTFFSAYFKTAEEEFYIEPLQRFEKSAGLSTYVSYRKQDVLPTAAKCVTLDAKEWDHSSASPSFKSDGCLTVEYALAADYSMLQKHGSPENILLHVSTVINMVNAEYVDVFSHDLQFLISEQFTSTCSSCNPWDETTYAQDLLRNFDDWGPIGFLNPHDLGSLWTDRNFDGSTVAVAWIGKVCTSKRYNCIQDFSDSYATLRMVNTHELGHNFDAHHDAPGTQFVMTPAVNPAFTAWSPSTVAEIDAHISSRDCLSNCTADVTDGIGDLRATLQAKVFLMGFYDKSLQKMTNDYLALDLIPRNQPFNKAPWFYEGDETVANFVDGTMDWVLLELHEANNPGVVVARKAVLIDEIGNLIDQDGSQNLKFPEITDGNYHLVVNHKSHLRIKTNQIISFDSVLLQSIDLRSVDPNHPSHHLHNLNGEIQVMYCGDYDQNGVINFLDLINWHGSFENTAIYVPEDGTGDGVVGLEDIVFWLDFQNVLTF